MTEIFSMKSYELGPLAAIHPGLTGPWSANTLASAHRFLFGDHAQIPEPFIKFGQDLLIRGLFRLPFQFTIFEFLFGPSDAKWLDRFVLLCEQVDRRGFVAANNLSTEDVPDDDPPILVLIWPLIRGKDGVWTPREYDETGEKSCIMLSTGQPSPIEGPLARQHPDFTKRKGWEQITNMAVCLCPAATAMMMSRSATVERVSVPPKVAAARARDKKPSLFQFHVVKVPTETRTRQNAGEFPRKSPMLHWRRGHYRQMSLGRVVPVSPCLVGAEERGVIAKAYDGIEAHIGAGPAQRPAQIQRFPVSFRRKPGSK